MRQFRAKERLGEGERGEGGEEESEGDKGEEGVYVEDREEGGKKRTHVAGDRERKEGEEEGGKRGGGKRSGRNEKDLSTESPTTCSTCLLMCRSAPDIVGYMPSLISVTSTVPSCLPCSDIRW